MSAWLLLVVIKIEGLMKCMHPIPMQVALYRHSPGPRQTLSTARHLPSPPLLSDYARQALCITHRSWAVMLLFKLLDPSPNPGVDLASGDQKESILLPEQAEVEVQVGGAQLLTALVSTPSCASVAAAPSSQGTAPVGGTPGAQAA